MTDFSPVHIDHDGQDYHWRPGVKKPEFAPTIKEQVRLKEIHLEQQSLAERNQEIRNRHKEEQQHLLEPEKAKQEADAILKTGVLHNVLTMQSEPDFPNRVREYHQTLIDEQSRAEETSDIAAEESAQIQLKMLEAIVSIEEIGTWQHKKNMNEKLTAKKTDYDWQAPRPSIDMRGIHAKEVHHPEEAPRLNAEAKVRSDISTRFGGDVDAYRDLLTEAIKSNEQGSDTKNLESLRDKLKVVDVMQRGQEITKNQARIASQEADINSRAKAEVLQNLLATGISKNEYRAKLDEDIAYFTAESSEFDDESPEMANLKKLQAQREALNEIAHEEAVVAKTKRETIPTAAEQRKGILEARTRETLLAKEAIDKDIARNNKEIVIIAKERDALSRWHWIKRGDLQAAITELENKNIELNGKLQLPFLESVKGTVKPEYRAPKIEVSARPEITAEELESLEEESIAA